MKNILTSIFQYKRKNVYLYVKCRNAFFKLCIYFRKTYYMNGKIVKLNT